MYLPSMLFGGSALLHLLAGHPRVVAVFGLGALVSTLLTTPFGVLNVPGTASHVVAIEQSLLTQDREDAMAQEEARKSAQDLGRSPKPRLAEVIQTTLDNCGAGCVGLDVKTVLKDPTLLDKVLYVHELNRLHEQSHAGGGKAPVNITDRP